MNIYLLVTKDDNQRLFICKAAGLDAALRMCGLTKDEVGTWQIYGGDLNIINSNPQYAIQLLECSA
jgi:hypothetical protein